MRAKLADYKDMRGSANALAYSTMTLLRGQLDVSALDVATLNTSKIQDLSEKLVSCVADIEVYDKQIKVLEENLGLR